MLKKITLKDYAWIDIAHPAKEDIEYVRENFNICDAVLNRLIPPIKRSEIEEYNGYFFIILHFPVFDAEGRKSFPEELDIIVTKNALVTSHNGHLAEHNNFFNTCNGCEKEKNINLEKGHMHLLYHLLDSLIDAQLPMIDHIAENISKIEENVFKGREQEMLREIAIVKRDIINFRRIIKPQHAILETMNKKADDLFGAKYMKKLDRDAQEIIGSNIKIWNTLENHKEMIEAIGETNEGLLSNKLNETMKLLTAVSVILAPMAMLVNMWGMNVNGMPFSDNQYGFAIIFLITLITGIILTLYFKNKKWV